MSFSEFLTFSRAIIETFQTLVQSPSLLRLVTTLAWFTVPLIIFRGIFGINKVFFLRFPLFEKAYVGDEEERIYAWEAFLKHQKGLFQTNRAYVEKVGDSCVALGFLGTSLGLIASVGSFSSNPGDLDLSGLHSAFSTTALGAFFCIAINMMLSRKQNRIEATLCNQERELDQEKRKKLLKGSSENSRVARLERAVLGIHDKLDSEKEKKGKKS